jgi:SAM-dependent methyltransferase
VTNVPTAAPSEAGGARRQPEHRAIQPHLVPRDDLVVVYDPHAFRGTASYYTIGRPAYSNHLVATLVEALGLDGTGELLDVGCGPGVLTVELAPVFETAVGLDPDLGMLAEGQRRAETKSVGNIRWVQAVAEDIPVLGIGPCELVTFGQSFHRTRRGLVAQAVYDLLQPGGAIAMIAHAVEGRPKPPGTGHPEIPHAEVRELIGLYLGDGFQVQTGDPCTSERFEESLSRSRFGGSHVVFAPGRPDLVRTTDSVVAGYFSMSYAAPRVFGDKRGDFEQDLRSLLRSCSPDGLFWDWPGDTEIVFARK